MSVRQTLTLSQGMVTAAFLSAGALSFGCKSPGGSALRHTVGEVTTRSQPLTCTPEEPQPPVAALHSYLTEHIARIRAAGSVVIPPEFSVDKFCLKVVTSPDVNAYARADGTIVILTGLTQITQSDAQVASIVAHELAHVLQSHGLDKMPREMAENPAYHKVASLVREQREALTRLETQIGNIGMEAQKKSPPMPPERRNKIDLYRQILDQYAGRLEMDPNRYANQDLYKNIVNAAVPESARGTAIRFPLRRAWPEPTLVAMAQDARQGILRASDTLFRAHFLTWEKDYLSALSQYLGHMTKYGEAERRAIQIMAKDAGLERASNWKEQDADEVGYELYLRAGYHRDEALKSMNNLRRWAEEPLASRGSAQNQGAAFTPDALGGTPNHDLRAELLATTCVRGTDSHPKGCWRIENLAQEWVKHQDFYSQITPRNPIIDWPESPLPELRKKFGSRPNRGSTTPPTPWCDPYQPTQCYPYCKDLTSDPALTGWGHEAGQTCVMRGGPVDRRY